MAIIIPDASEVHMLNLILANDVNYHLYKLPATAPDEDTVIGDLTELTEAGYAAITVADTAWTVTTTSGVTTASAAEITFTTTEAATAYGLYVTDSTNTDLLYLEKFDGSGFNLPSGGGNINITPTLSLD